MKEQTAPTDVFRHEVTPTSSGRGLIAAHVLSDASILVVALALAAVARFSLGWLAYLADPDLSWQAYVIAGVVWVAAVLRGLAARGCYDEDTLTEGGGEMARVWQSIVEGVAVVAVASFLIRGEQLSRSWFLMAVILSAILLPVERLIFRRVVRRLRERGSLRRAAILIGTGSDAIAAAEHLGEFDIVERMDAASFLARAEHADPEDAAGRAVLIDASALDEDTLWEVVLAAGQQGALAFVMSPLRPVTSQRLTMRSIEGTAVMRVLPPRITGVRAAEKRLLDIVVTLLVAPFAIVIGAVVAVVQLLTAGPPIFYGQERLGTDEAPFTLWKFRSMAEGAEDDTGPVMTAKEDPRRTALGRFLRRWSLDELPQLWSVLVGKMSLVGPRPERKEFVERFNEEMRWYRYRLRIKPGMTGNAQARGFRGQSSLVERLELDNWYIENWSLALDLQILARTVVAVIRGNNAE